MKMEKYHFQINIDLIVIIYRVIPDIYYTFIYNTHKIVLNVWENLSAHA